MRTTRTLITAAVLIAGVPGWATELTLHLNSDQPIRRQTVQYQCDAQGAAMGLPAGPFAVEYVNGGGNSLAIVPVHGGSLIFANVSSGSGARSMPVLMKLLEAKTASPIATSSLASMRFISHGTIGMITSCGSPDQASTAPICSAL